MVGIALLAAFLPSAPVQEQPRLLSEDGALYLAWMGDTLMLRAGRPYDLIPSNAGPTQFTMAKGIRLVVAGDVLCCRPGQPAERLESAKAPWRVGHKLRLRCTVANAVKRGNTLFAIATWQNLSPSGEPAVGQDLVRIDVEPKFSVRLVKSFTPAPRLMYHEASNPAMRLFGFEGKLLFVKNPGSGVFYVREPSKGDSELVEMDEQGNLGKTLARFPARMQPIGYMNGRTIVLGEPFAKRPFFSLDLKTKRLAAIPGDWNGYFAPSYVYTPTEGNRILVVHDTNPDEDRSKFRTYVVDVRTGGVRSWDNPTGTVRNFLWKGRAIELSDQVVTLRDSSTGQVLTKLPLPE